MIYLDSQQIDRLLEEPLIRSRVKIESLIMPCLDLRPCTQVTIPAEFPKGIELGKKIDEIVKPQLEKLQSIKEPRARLMAVAAIKQLLEVSFHEIVEGSEQYRVFFKWIKELGLNTKQVMTRPSVHEVFIFKELETGKSLEKIIRDKEKIRLMVQRRPNPNMSKVKFAFPEEFDKTWVRRMGDLLNYPNCCCRQFTEDRLNNVNAELRIAKQLAKYLTKNMGEIDTHVFPFAYFYPCSPACEKSIAQGIEINEKLSDLDPRVGYIYSEMLKINVEMVLNQPALISRYISRARV